MLCGQGLFYVRVLVFERLKTSKIATQEWCKKRESMAKPNTYIGIDKDLNGGMTTIGKIIRDAWVFKLIPETETCEGWNLAGIDALLDKVNAEWDKYGCLASRLPAELYERHKKFHDAAIANAKAAGWAGENETEDDK